MMEIRSGLCGFVGAVCDLLESQSFIYIILHHDPCEEWMTRCQYSGEDVERHVYQETMSRPLSMRSSLLLLPACVLSPQHTRQRS